MDPFYTVHIITFWPMAYHNYEMQAVRVVGMAPQNALKQIAAVDDDFYIYSVHHTLA